MEHPSLERRVEILEDFEGRLTVVEAQIVQLRTDMSNGFSALSYAINRMHIEILVRFENIDRRFDAVDNRFERNEARFDAMDRRFDAIDQRLDAMDRRFDAMDHRFDRQDAELAAIRQQLE